MCSPLFLPDKPLLNGITETSTPKASKWMLMFGYTHFTEKAKEQNDS